MKYYDDNTNKAGMRVLFMFMQMLILLIVFSIIYTSLVAVEYAIKEKGIDSMASIPVWATVILYPVLLYKYRKMFNQGKMLGASIWTIASSSVIIIMLYLYIDKLAG